MKPLYIFDLDRTLADTSHRTHYNRGTDKDWRGFFAAAKNDPPIRSGVETFKALSRVAEVWIWTGRSDEVLHLAPLAEKWRAFGWRTLEVNGHDIPALITAMRSVDPGSDVPTAILADTVKGKGVSFMEDDNNWHYRIPSADEFERARKVLGVVGARLGPPRDTHEQPPHGTHEQPLRTHERTGRKTSEPHKGERS